MSYIENPKTKESGIICCIPQTGVCPNGCEDCFFQSGRSYLEPLDKNLPNMPEPTHGKPVVVRINDGNDSNVDRVRVIDTTSGKYPMRFYNTAIPKDLGGFPGPVVLTINPGKMTDTQWHLVAPIPKNLMYVRFRINAWNLSLCDEAVKYYTKNGIPVILTFMAYHDEDRIPLVHRSHYNYRKRTLNSYWAITHGSWNWIMTRYNLNPLVHSCGTEGIPGGSACRNCGNCLREYFATMERMNTINV